ncbi:MAG TPA: hypothetical protein VHC00_11695 [Rhizobiaceae bacterium]|nr:hypothetical protein [Rhizobiaceae bacterium]
MHDSFKARPVSGEIMTDDIANAGIPVSMERDDRRDILEAEFETIRPKREPGFRKAPVNAPEGIELLRDGSRLAPARSEHGGFAFWAVGVILVVMAFLASGGYVLMSGGGSGSPARGERNESFHAASTRLRDIDAKRYDGPAESHFLGTSGGGVKSLGSFVFSDSLEAPKDGGKSVSTSFDEEN